LGSPAKSRRKKIGSGEDNKVSSLDPGIFNMLKLTQSDVIQIMDLINQEMGRASVFFDFTGVKRA
jgi:hypothetical protein